jgi:hypothetical protein
MRALSLTFILLFSGTKVLAQIPTDSLWSLGYSNNYGGVKIENNTGTLGASPIKTDGLGILYESTITSFFSWEIGLIKNPYSYKFYNSSLGLHYVRRFDALEIPISIRFPVFAPFFYLGGGFYLRQGIGNVYTKVDDGSSETSGSFSEANLKAFDSGIHALASVEIPILDEWRIFVDGRYNYGLDNASTLSGATGTFQSYYFLFGIKYGVRPIVF